MKDVELLQRLGLSSLESHIYYTLLSQPTMTLSEIVRTSKLQRTSVHRALPSLVSRKLVDEVPVGRRIHYRAVSPTKLTALVDELAHDVAHLIPRLEERVAQTLDRPILTTRRGVNAVQDALETMLEELPRGGTFYRYRPSTTSVQGKNFATARYHQLEKEKDIQRLWISTSRPENLRKDLFKELNRAIRVLSPDIPKDPYLNQYIYNNKILLVDFLSATVITIEHEAFAAFQKFLFLLMFHSLPKT